MKVTDFDYDLPSKLIAQYPPKIRGTSNLLVFDRASGSITDEKYFNIVNHLSRGDVLVLNNTKVMRARLMAQKPNGAKRELVILEKHSGDNDWHHHKVLYRGRLKIGDELFVEKNKIVVDDIIGNGVAVVSSQVDLIELTNQFGKPPLPPYMKRDATSDDIERYQTVFARDVGSAAAPTASLNMTSELMERLRAKGVKICYVTLHVGLGTFMPVRSDNIEDHKIHTEFFQIPTSTVEAINGAKTSGKRVIALGTTVARTLEYAYSSFSKTEGNVIGEADIYIYPGYKFKCVDALITNFHAPRSTVLLLTAAFVGQNNLKNAYEHAIHKKYNFLSYGDSMLIL